MTENEIKSATILMAKSLGWFKSEKDSIWWMAKTKDGDIIVASDNSMVSNYWNPRENMSQLIMILKNMIGNDKSFLWKTDNMKIRNSLLRLDEKMLFDGIYEHLQKLRIS